MIRLLSVILLALTLVPATAQDDCTFDFSKVIPMLQAAKTLDEVVAARVQIQLQEAYCTDYRQGHGGESRTNPVPFGEIQDASADDFDAVIHVTDYVDDAEEMVLTADSHNDPASTGKRYVVISFNFECNRWPDESCELSPFHFSLVGDKGLSYRAESNSVRGLTEKQELFGGGAVTANFAFLVDDDDGHFVLFTEYGDPRVYFATE